MLKTNPFSPIKSFIYLFSIFILLHFIACKTDKKPTTPANSPSTTKRPQTAYFNGDSAYYFIQKQVEFGPRVPGTPEHLACSQWLESKLKTYTPHTTIQKSSAKAHDGKELPIYNIIASFNPDVKKRILLCAHWDTRPNADRDTSRQNEAILGANDGGSGVGVLLEIARQLSKKPTKMGVDIILFDTEDYGAYGIDNSFCLGSQYWGKNKHVANYTAKFGILLDMVGAPDATFLKERHSLAFAEPVVKKVWKTAYDLGYESYFLNTITPAPITDDHLYVNQLANIPTIDIIHYTQTGEFGDFWHTHQDNMDIISKNTLVAVGKTVLTVLYQEDVQ